jgi:hypothetical protein
MSRTVPQVTQCANDALDPAAFVLRDYRTQEDVKSHRVMVQIDELSSDGIKG